MPGIAGIISALDHTNVQRLLHRMADAMQRPDALQTRDWAGEQAGMIAIGPQAEQMISIYEGCVLAISGQITVDETLIERLRRVPMNPESEKIGAAARQPVSQNHVWVDEMALPLARRLLMLYLEEGVSALQGLNGAYTVAIWEEALARLTIIGDRGGMQPLYYWQNGEELVFATRTRALAEHPRFPRAIDPVSVFSLLAAEQMLDERTLYANAQALPPAGLLTFSAGQLRVQSYWQPHLYQAGEPVPTESAAIDEMAQRVEQSVNRLITGVSQASLLLTGGLDSRLAAAALARRSVPVPITAYTIGHERARDVIFGRQIAQATGFKHTVLPPNPRYLADYAAECVRRTEGGINVHAAWILQVADELTRMGIPAVMDGVGAEAVSGRHWLSEQPVTTRDAAVDRLTGARWTFSRAAALLRPEIRDEAQQAAREIICRTIKDAPAETLLGWADYFAYRQNRRHPTGNILSDTALVLEPFFDNDLVDYVVSLPPALRGAGTLYKKMIVQHFPIIAGIRYTDSGAPLMEEVNGLSLAARARSRWRNLNRRASRRLARELPFLRRPPYGDNPSLAIYYNHWLRTQSRDFVTGLLKREELFADFLDVGQVRQLVSDHMSGKIHEFRLVDGVLTFALWREMFG